MTFNNETLRCAIKLFLCDQEVCETDYGRIEEWDVSNVTDMSEIFLCANALIVYLIQLPSFLHLHYGYYIALMYIYSLIFM